MRKVVWYVLCCVVFCQFLFRTFSPPLQSLGQATCNATVSLQASQELAPCGAVLAEVLRFGGVGLGRLQEGGELGQV